MITPIGAPGIGKSTLHCSITAIGAPDIGKSTLHCSYTITAVGAPGSIKSTLHYGYDHSNWCSGHWKVNLTLWL